MLAEVFGRVLGFTEGLAERMLPQIKDAALELVVDGLEAWRGAGFPRYYDEEVSCTAVVVGHMQEFAKTRLPRLAVWPESSQYSRDILEGRADPMRASRIDIAVSTDLLRRGHGYVSVECKLLSPGTGAELYVSEGMLRFIDGRYASSNRLGVMVGYVVAGEVDVLWKDVNEKILDHAPPLSAADTLSRADPIRGLNSVFRSIHDRSSPSPRIELTHIHFDIRGRPSAPKRPREKRRPSSHGTGTGAQCKHLVPSVESLGRQQVDSQILTVASEHS